MNARFAYFPAIHYANKMSYVRTKFACLLRLAFFGRALRRFRIVEVEMNETDSLFDRHVYSWDEVFTSFESQQHTVNRFLFHIRLKACRFWN